MAITNMLSGLGDFVTSGNTSPGTAMTTGVAVNGASITLTTGSWLVWGSIYVNPNPVSSMSTFTAWVSTSSATAPDPGLTTMIAVAGMSGSTFPVLPRLFTISGSTTVYISTQAVFSGTCSLNRASISAERVRVP